MSDDRVEDFIGLGVPKGKPFGTKVISGNRALEVCIGFFERTSSVDEAQKLLFNQSERKWAAVVIDGKRQIGNLSLFYVLVPTVTVLGLDGGSGYLVLCESSHEAEAKEAIASTLEGLMARMHRHQWYEITDVEG